MDEGVDTGPIILQKAVEIPEGSSVEEITQLILKEEHQLYIKAIKLFCENKLVIEYNTSKTRKIVRIKSS
jgi:phosphoribosylglycinamide formyltransferase-1